MSQGSTEMLEGLALAASHRDGAADRHSSRVGEVSARLAKAAGMAQDDVLVLRRAAAWHDVGKVGIPHALLLKPGPLTADEMRIMRTHTTIGAHILSSGDTPVIKMAKSIALSHHERWDGTGYPNRLSGDAIPLSGRIVAVADAFDALTNDRPYRRRRSVREALAEIARHRNSQFDGRVVDALTTALAQPKDLRVCPPSHS